jgi:hypothetical protein
MDQRAGHAEAQVYHDHLKTKVYTHCDNRCLRCRQCREFEKLIDQIDFENKSELEKQRESQRELRRER